MERREPTLTGNSNNERDDIPTRRSAAYDDEPRSKRASQSYAAPSSSPLPAIALVVALIGVAGAAFLGFTLMEAQAKLEKDAARIQQLENQLNVASTESTQSVAALGINLQKADADIKKLQETVRKLNSDHNDKLASLGKSIEGAKSDINNIKSDANSTKQDVLSHKASLDEVFAHLDLSDKSVAESRKKLQDVSASVNALVSQVKSAEGLASRITKTEEAIDAIDDNRRIINRDLLQIKQQLNIK